MIMNELDFEEIKFTVKIRHTHQIEKMVPVNITCVGYESKEKHPNYVSKRCFEEKYKTVQRSEKSFCIQLLHLEN